MNRILSFVFFLLVFAGATAQKSPSTTENYITTTTCLSSDCAEKAVTVQYFDGLGRLKQVVDVAASPTGKDIVTPVKYDAFGRQDKDFLPLPQSGTEGGAIYPDGVGAAGEVYEQNGRLFAEKKFENSPLDRLLEQTAPGDAWNGRPVKFGYDTNTSNEVRKYTTTTVWANGATVSELNPADYYGAGELYKNTVSDEDGNVSIEFKNGRGQVLLIRKNDGNKNADTYYVYNEYDLLAFVIPPSAAASPALDTDTLDKLCYRYRYDGRGRLAEKQLPGKGPEYMVYDKQDRLVLVQDANQKGKQWNFTKYDWFGRVVYTGLFANTSTRKAMQSALDAMQANPGNNEKRSDTGFSLGGMTVYYTKEAFPKSSMTVLSVNYYDTYPPGSPAYTALISGQSVLTDNAANGISTKSLPTATYIRNIEDDSWTKSYFWYDTRGRNIATRSINHLGGYTLTESKLDFTGNPLTSVTQHRRTADAAAVTVTENFFYDMQKRLVKHTHKVDGGAEETLAENTYNELGQLENKKVGGSLQSIDYRYNIRGWLTGINNPSDLGGKLFGMTLNYNGPLLGVKRPNDEYPGLEIEPKYNGNIAEMRWNSGSGAKVYGYVYDGLSRLKAGFYQDSTDPYAKENNEILVYDVNGNIKELKRTARIFGNSVLMIDNLEYAYDGNRVTSITDHSKNKSGYEGGGNLITYDANGNMTKMPDKKIDAIAYNHLNLPNAFVLPRNQSLSYTYRADGVKIAKRNMIGSPKASTVVTDYLDGFQYSQKTDHGLIGSREALDSDFAFEREAFEVDEVIELRTAPPTLEIFPTAEGFYDYQNKRYIYQYRDHLGNIRVSFTRNGNSPEVLDTNDYYPFGMNFLNSDLVSYLAQPWSKYKYNGKELQESGMYDYGARMYMPDIGRWGVPDPLAEKMTSWSPYSYAFDNPIKFVDPTGMAPEQIDPTEFNKTADAKNKMALHEFVRTKEGYNILAKYAKSGDVVAGVKFSKDGEFHKSGMDLKLTTKTVNSMASGETGTTMKNGRLEFSVSSSNGSRYIATNMETLGHELFIHALPQSLDFADDKKLNLSSGYFSKPASFLKSLGYTAENNDSYGDIFGHYQEKVTHNARNKYIAPILKEYFNKINKNVSQESINKSIDGFIIPTSDDRIKY